MKQKCEIKKHLIPHPSKCQYQTPIQLSHKDNHAHFNTISMV